MARALRPQHRAMARDRRQLRHRCVTARGGGGGGSQGHIGNGHWVHPCSDISMSRTKINVLKRKNPLIGSSSICGLIAWVSLLRARPSPEKSFLSRESSELQWVRGLEHQAKADCFVCAMVLESNSRANLLVSALTYTWLDICRNNAQFRRGSRIKRALR